VLESIVGWRKMNVIKKILNVLKNVLEWTITIILILLGYTLFKSVKDRFGPSPAEKGLLAEIEKNEEKLRDLEKESQSKVEKEENLAKEQEEIQQKIDELKDEYYKKQEEFVHKEQEIVNSTHEENIDYINKKYCKD